MAPLAGLYCLPVLRRKLLAALALDAPPLTPGMARVQGIVIDLTARLGLDRPKERKPPCKKPTARRSRRPCCTRSRRGS